MRIRSTSALPSFRNVLAHSYASVSYDRAYDALSEIPDLERFAGVVAARIAAAP